MVKKTITKQFGLFRGTTRINTVLSKNKKSALKNFKAGEKKKFETYKGYRKKAVKASDVREVSSKRGFFTKASDKAGGKLAKLKKK